MNKEEIGMMTCKEVERMLLECGDDVSESCRNHLVHCSSCREYRDIVMRLSALSRESAGSMECPSAEVDARVMMMAHVSLSRRRRLLMLRRAAVSVAACVALLLVVVWHVGERSEGRMEVAGSSVSALPGSQGIGIAAPAASDSGTRVGGEEYVDAKPLEFVVAEWSIEQLESDLALLPSVLSEQFGSVGVDESDTGEPSQSVVIGSELRSFATELREMEMMMVAY